MKKLLNRIKKQQKVEYTLFNSIPIIIKDKLTSNIDLEKLVHSIEALIPPPPPSLIKTISIEDNPIFGKRKVNALYHNRILYLSNNQDNLNDMLDDIIHEYSHALEEKYTEEIYADQSIREEFLIKRSQLELQLRAYGFDTSKYNFKDINLDRKLDNFLLNVVGYKKLEKLTNYGLFINAYAATSLREYFATGFEEYVLGDSTELANISPKLLTKIKEIIG